jgi:competence protein ComEA
VKSFSKDQQVIALMLGLAILFISLSRSSHPFRSILGAPNNSQKAEPHHQWIIEVAGAVKTPGIYTFDEPPTAYQAIQMAGGPTCGHRFGTPGSALNTGMRVELQESKRDSPLSITSMGSRERLVLGIPIELNQAGAADLAMIPGISQALSHRIVEFREIHGPFKAWHELRRVKGIGPKKVQRFRSYLSLTNTRRSQERGHGAVLK